MSLRAAAGTTEHRNYTERLVRGQSRLWKRLLDVQRPYRWNLRQLHPGFTVEVGCGVGRNLGHLAGSAVGVDHNSQSVEVCRSRGYIAFTPQEFRESMYWHPGTFDSLLVAHVAEHMQKADFVRLLSNYVHLVKSAGQLIVITPQEAGFRSDPTHVEFMDFAKIRECVHEVGFAPSREYSFPLPRFAGHVFTYNEFVSVSRSRPASCGI